MIYLNGVPDNAATPEFGKNIAYFVTMQKLFYFYVALFINGYIYKKNKFIFTITPKVPKSD